VGLESQGSSVAGPTLSLSIIDKFHMSLPGAFMRAQWPQHAIRRNHCCLVLPASSLQQPELFSFSFVPKLMQGLSHGHTQKNFTIFSLFFTRKWKNFAVTHDFFHSWARIFSLLKWKFF